MLQGSYRVDGTLGSGFDSAEPGARLDLKPCSQARGLELM